MGHVISGRGVAIDPKKVEALNEWKQPKNVKDIQSFLGPIGYYLCFIDFFSKIDKPMTTLLKNQNKFKWMPRCEESFWIFKKKLTTVSVLILPDNHKYFEIYCDAYLQGLGCVLMQDMKVAAYASKNL